MINLFLLTLSVLSFSVTASAANVQTQTNLYKQVQILQNDQDQWEDMYIQNQAAQTAQYIQEHDQQHPDTTAPDSFSNLPYQQPTALPSHTMIPQSAIIVDQNGRMVNSKEIYAQEYGKSDKTLVSQNINQ